MKELVKSPVVFFEDTHTYMLGDRQLQGITGMLSRQLFNDKYKAVPKAVLDKAAERGHNVHKECELWDKEGLNPTTIEGKNYIKLCKKHKLQHVASEYLVSDNEYYASCIDKVYGSGDGYILVDIKTTYTPDEEYLQWQLSVYAYLFELQNPGAKVVGLYGMWLRDTNAKLIGVDRVSTDIIQDLMQSYINGLPFVYVIDEPKSLPEKYRAVEGKIAYIIEMEKYWTGEKKRLVDGIRKEMVQGGAYKWEGEKVKITRNKESIRKEFDKESFKKDYPELFEKYIKEVSVSGSLTIKSI